MSVDIAGNPWKFAQDGSGTNPIGFEYKNALSIVDAFVTKLANIGDRIYFTDESGRSVIDFTAEQVQDSFRFGKMGIIYGLKCVQFDSGELTISV